MAAGISEISDEDVRGFLIGAGVVAILVLFIVGVVLWYTVPPFVQWLYKDIPPLTPMAKKAKRQTRGAFPVVQSPEQQLPAASPGTESEGPQDMSYPR